MVTGLACGFGILAVILGLLLFKLIRQIRELERQIRFLEEKQSNGNLVCDVRFGGIGKLTDTLNQVFAQQKTKRQQWIRNENRIAQTYTNLSHDIRTPLTSLDGYFQLLTQTQEPETQVRYLRIIQERIHALRDILEELFAFTRLESRTYDLKLEKCDFNAIMAETMFSYYDEWERNGIWSGGRSAGGTDGGEGKRAGDPPHSAKYHQKCSGSWRQPRVGHAVCAGGECVCGDRQ